MKKISVFIKNYSIGKSTSILNMLDFLNKNYSIDLYIQNVDYIGVELLKKFTILNFDIILSRNLIKRYFFKRKFKNYLKITSYTLYLVVDPHAFEFCLDLFPNAKPFYYCLELYIRETLFNLYYPENVMKKERSNINNISGLIIQSRERESIFRQEYSLNPNIPCFILPICYNGESDYSKSNYLRNKYGIDKSKKIALHLGGIQEYHSCIEMARSFKNQEDWVIFFHGYYFGDYYDKLKSVIRDEGLYNVIISDEVFDEIVEIEQIIKSADIGIAYYNSTDLNFYSAGKSSGKISAYLRFGLPVITNNHPSFIEAIEKTETGICISNADEITDALKRIQIKYDTYSLNAIKSYDKYYNFNIYTTDLLNFFENKAYKKIDF